MLGATAAALGSALFAALSSVLHHRAGVTCPGLAVVLRPMWLAGTLVAVGGLALHTVALQMGQLSLVQPLLVSGLLFALPMAALLEGVRVRPVQLAWALVIVAGLAVFLTSAQPAVGRGVADQGALARTTGLALLVAAVVYLAGVRWPRHRAALWALAGGCGYGIAAALLKDSIGLLGLGGSQLVTSWVFYALLVIGPTAVAVNQAAFNAGPLASSLPALTITDPVVAIILGAAAFGEATGSAPIMVAGQAIGFVVMSGGVVALSRCAGPSRETD